MKNLFNIFVSINLSLILLISAGSIVLQQQQQQQQANAQNTAEESQNSTAI
jgi:hypothetical protein